MVQAIWYLDSQGFTSEAFQNRHTHAGQKNLPRDDSEAEEDLLTLKARSESLSSGLLLWEVLEDVVEGGLDGSVPASQRQTRATASMCTFRFTIQQRSVRTTGLQGRSLELYVPTIKR